jgi:hypothetical protein
MQQLNLSHLQSLVARARAVEVAGDGDRLGGFVWGPLAHFMKNVTDLWACLVDEDPTSGFLGRIKRCVTFTEKTRHLFEINKGLQSKDTSSNPYLVNKFVPPEERRIPFANMIYVGDGLTDSQKPRRAPDARQCAPS